ncbi:MULTISPECIES: DUF7079 family protein [Chryseobacterium]|jgi:hypothetical protein|uniref:DUF7079 domain-containing protein n=1 Tax=Chryseobacterium lathyri TaxID=395933 RepID=A0A511YCB3_9FLAO|nr:hypothetical protein [Chryseobacterium lathyri]GEN72837.1 hypothetical protein CLA01_29090 [Chryseobacterium lathyri]
MLKPVNIEERKPVWIALSDFYLDTELQDFNFQYIVKTILESPYSFDDVKTINIYEVFPVLQPNLLQAAGEWAGFNEKWLLEAITDYLKTKTVSDNAMISTNYKKYAWMQEDYWQKLESIYNEMQEK